MPIDPTDNRYTANAAITDLAATAGTADATLADVGGAYSQVILNDNFRDVTAKINAILAALRESNVISKG
jgi:deoxyxylulose-5-phosphate synthase